jgi:hypothetical protein
VPANRASGYGAIAGLVVDSLNSPAQYAYSPPAMTAGAPTFGRMGTGARRAGTMGASGGSSGGTSCMKIVIWTKSRLGL